MPLSGVIREWWNLDVLTVNYLHCKYVIQSRISIPYAESWKYIFGTVASKLQFETKLKQQIWIWLELQMTVQCYSSKHFWRRWRKSKKTTWFTLRRGPWKTQPKKAIEHFWRKCFRKPEGFEERADVKKLWQMIISRANKSRKPPTQH